MVGGTTQEVPGLVMGDLDGPHVPSGSLQSSFVLL